MKDPDCNPSQTTDVSGADIVAFAQQFVGNPYVWGGNSLTNGVDCSGFVHQVYAHFGISTHGIPRHLRVWDSRCLIRISRREMSWYIRDMWQFTLETEISWRRSQQEPALQTAVR